MKSTDQPTLDAGAAEHVNSVRAAFSRACDAIPAMGPGARLLLGCSAGGDSMALLDLTADFAPARAWALHVAHFDHAQRPESAEEARFVQRRCAALGVDFRAGTLPSGRDFPPGLDEGSLRNARYEFFHRCLDATGAAALVLAHQADDRAETFLMRLLRGSGPTGLASIRPIEPLDGMTVARPLLGLRRTELRDYLRARSIDWLDDPSNDDERFKRVWVRHGLLPMINERMGMDLVPRLVRTCELSAEESSALSAAAALMLAQMESPADPPALSRLRLDHPLWRDAPPELRRVLLRQWLWKIRRSGHPPGYEAVQEAMKFVERAAPGARLRTVERIHLEKSGPSLLAWPDPDAGGAFPA
jgi:tRNA(Ile)-lysidine synthase